MTTVLNLNPEKKEKKNRDKLEIVTDILSVASVKTRKTRIMYQANLSYRLIEKYLKGLLDNGLIQCDNNSSYSITSRGKEFLQMYSNYIERCRRIHKDIKGARRERLLLESMCFKNEFNSKRIRK